MSDEGDIVVKFLEFVYGPLRNIESARRPNALAMIRHIQGLLTDLEASLENAAKSVHKELTSPSPSGTSGNGAGEETASPLEKWRLFIKNWAARERSIAREMEILRLLEESNGAVVLKNLHDRMIGLGLSDKGGQPAVVTQISRLKKMGAIAREGQGLYSMTSVGVERLQKMRSIHRRHWVPDDVRKCIA